MPSKIQLDENLWFLYICLQQSDYKSIDFNAVGEATNLKPPAARMRYTRLRRQIEGGTLIGAHGTPFSGGAQKTAEAKIKRKRSVAHGENLKSASTAIPRNRPSMTEENIKTEHKESFDECETASSDDSDSEDEIPLAKRRGGQITSANSSGALQPDCQESLEKQLLVDPNLRFGRRKSCFSEADLGNTYEPFCKTSQHALKSFHIGNGQHISDRTYAELYKVHYMNPEL